VHGLTACCGNCANCKSICRDGWVMFRCVKCKKKRALLKTCKDLGIEVNPMCSLKKLKEAIEAELGIMVKTWDSEHLERVIEAHRQNRGGAAPTPEQADGERKTPATHTHFASPPPPPLVPLTHSARCTSIRSRSHHHSSETRERAAQAGRSYVRS
jgi:hypothetical protein